MEVKSDQPTHGEMIEDILTAKALAGAITAMIRDKNDCAAIMAMSQVIASYMNRRVPDIHHGEFLTRLVKGIGLFRGLTDEQAFAEIIAEDAKEKGETIQ